jgi:uncharacterized protein (TIGR00730 family)
MSIQSICLFCGSSAGNKPVYRAAAEHFGRTLAERGIALIYGGGDVGLMGAAADAALAAGGRVVGVIPESLMAMEVGHRGLTELHVVGSMHERKALMASMADAFIALPGSFGTLDEMFEVLTWNQIGAHDKPVGLLNVHGYYDALVTFLKHVEGEGFLRPQHAPLLRIADDLDALLLRLAEPLPKYQKWHDRESVTQEPRSAIRTAP